MANPTSQEELERQVGHPLRRSTDMKSMDDVSVTIGRLEQSIESTNVALRDFAGRTSDDISRLSKNIEELTKNQFLGKQTNWGMIASWAAVLVLLLGLVVYQPLQEIRGSIGDHKQDGHPHSVINRIENNEERFVDITTRLQHEIKLLEQADNERTIELKRRIKETEDWVLQHQSESPTAHARFEERIKALKERVDRMTPAMHKYEQAMTQMEERTLNLEREVFAGATYRSGRPTKPPGKK